MHKHGVTLLSWAIGLVLFGSALACAQEQVLFDFETPGDLAKWSNVNLSEALAKQVQEDNKATAAKDPAAKLLPVPAVRGVPPVKIEQSPENATSGKSCLKLTYAGGKLPTVGTDAIPANWKLFKTSRAKRKFKTFRADVTVTRECVVIFRVLRDKSRRGFSWNECGSRYEKVARLEPGRNVVIDCGPQVPVGESVARFEISMYSPQKGESIYVDNIRLSNERPSPASTPYSYYNIRYMGQVKTPYNVDFPKLDRKIKVLGTDWEFDDLTQLGDKVKDKWVMPSKRTVDDVESAFAKTFAELKKTHPGAVMTILRQGQTGYDPQHPDRAFTGWKNAFLSGHDPGPVYARQLGTGTSHKTEFELNGRHRCPLFQVDLTAIPKGSRILSAQLLLVLTKGRNATRKLDPKGSTGYKYSPLKPTLYVAEPCNRAWDEATCNGLEYARGKFWKEPCGMYWQGDDPDFFPIVLAYGQSGLDVSTVDFTEGVKYWTDGKHENHGFSLSFVWHYYDLFKFWTRKAPNLKDRPAMMVIHEPGK